MGKYLKAAFWISPNVPGIGRIPLNVLALGGFAILGFGHPGFWFLGLALEASWLFGIAQNVRFRKLIDAREYSQEALPIAEQRAGLVAKLSPDSRKQLGNIESKCQRALQLQAESGVQDLMLDMNRDALDKLTWSFTKLLLARENLMALGDASVRRDLQQKIDSLKRELDGRVSLALRESKDATLKILQQRLAHFDRRKQSLEEIESDLTRIDAQIDLAVDSAGLRGKDHAISAEIHFTSQFLDDFVYGDVSDEIAALDRTFSAPAHPISSVTAPPSKERESDRQ